MEEERNELIAEEQHHCKQVFCLTPSTTEKEIKKISQREREREVEMERPSSAQRPLGKREKKEKTIPMPLLR